MTRRLEFFFDFRSPYSYLANSQLERLDAEVTYRPLEIVELMKQVGNVPTSIVCKPKNRYLGADLRRWVAIYGVPFQPHPEMGRIDARRLLRAVLAADESGQAREAVGALFTAFWGIPAPLATPADVVAVLNGAGVGDAGLTSRIDDPALDEALDEATAAAVERGVFGAPVMFVGEEMFFGNDRLDFVRSALARQEAA
ncbi:MULTISPECIES: 2-hydroxychromene-2-carboxylate isomerase [unclassified Phenylobacterium]|uniref:2-hydroxychromene-2-carboxylate isomerase n=1 Tax=unclassified Phenylobacterium TaxID=2640670 RepID=UPI00083AC42B|nr:MULTISPECIES: 2-hydroxychromene-2-carboxylate isomerase [unclassified Phenylobacterium]